MTLYDVTGIVSGNETSILTILQGVNTELMGGWFGIMFLLGLAVVFFTSIAFTTNDISKAAGGTSFIIFSLSLSMLAMELIPPVAFFISLILCAGLIAISWPK